MSKYLRNVEFRGFLRNPMYDERAENSFEYFATDPNFLTGFWAYFRNALPVRCDGVGKINFYGCDTPNTVCGDPVLTIATMWASLPKLEHGSTQTSVDQQRFMVQLAHRGMSIAADYYRFDINPFLISLEGF